MEVEKGRASESSVGGIFLSRDSAPHGRDKNRPPTTNCWGSGPGTSSATQDKTFKPDWSKIGATFDQDFTLLSKYLLENGRLKHRCSFQIWFSRFAPTDAHRRLRTGCLNSGITAASSWKWSCRWINKVQIYLPATKNQVLAISTCPAPYWNQGYDRKNYLPVYFRQISQINFPTTRIYYPEFNSTVIGNWRCLIEL